MRAAGLIASPSASDAGWVEINAWEVISGAGIGAKVGGDIGSGSGCHGSGRPIRSLTTTTGPLSGNIAFAANSKATSAKPTDARKASAGIELFHLKIFGVQASTWLARTDRCRADGGSCKDLRGSAKHHEADPQIDVIGACLGANPGIGVINNERP